MALLGLFLLAFSGMAFFYVGWAAASNESGDQTIDPNRLILPAAISFVAGITLIVLGCWLLKRTDFRDYDAADPDQPRLKF